MSHSKTTKPQSQSMAKSVAKGAAWSTLANIARIASALFVLPILARFLTPEEFGIMQIAMPIVLFLLMFNDFGFGPALVRAKNLSQNAWRSVFWINLIIGLLMTAVLFIISEPIANWFQVPEAKSIIQTLSFLIALNSVIVTPAADLQRRMKFNILSMIEVSSITIGIVVAIFAAIEGYGAWSLVIQQLSLFTIKSVLMWAYSRPPIKPTIIISELKALFGFSSNLMGARFVNFLARNADNLIIGRVLGTAALGFYSIAYRILLLPVEIFAWGLSQVLMPAVSKFQDDKPRMQSAVLRTFRLISFFTFPSMIGIAILAEPLVIILLGERMAPAAAILQILAPLGAIQSLSSTQGAIYMALGRTDILFKISSITTVVSILGFLIGVQWGLKGVAIAYLITTTCLQPYTFTRLLPLLELPVQKMLGSIQFQFLASMIMGIIVIIVYHLSAIQSFDKLLQVIFLVPIGCISYLSAIWFLDKTLIKEFLRLFKDVSSK
ncbi:lipopolysaccharide biosynthesis protein [Hirschia maritima]|uniref:lipopolysaccharide biosynthesis protein n=1 Tax=Hirschia maritima TaxID=1121961 RepID=UPI0003A4F2EE|nr:lipopolysaccharide biosynthesis protein [Hirschia maritima]